ncbi:MAG: immune inhibitor A, partial [Candidatus Poseidoniia archaeon]|nr:immune inhibitor A [Candidatus Poseidoniia archaeon]
GDESKSDGEYESGWDYSIYTSSEYGLSAGGQLKFQHYYSTESSTYPYDGGNVQITTNDGENWEVIYPVGGYPGDSVSGLDGESGYYGDSGGWVEASFDLSNFSGEDVRFRFRFGSDSITDNYEGWYFDNVELTDSVSGTLLSDDFEDGGANWDDAPQVFNVSLHYQGDYRVIVSPFTFAFVNNSEDREDMVGRALDWLRAAAAADDVGVDSLYIETPTNENSTIAFSSVIKNYGSEDQTAFEVEARVEDAEGNELWSQTKIVTNLESGEEETLDWEWESENPREVTFVVETLKDDESHRNNLMKEDIGIAMICIPEITTFNDHKEGEPSDDIMFDLIISNRASGDDIFDIEMTGSAASWGQIANQLELHSNESRDIELALKIDEDTELGDYDLNIVIVASDGTTEELELLVTVTDNPVNYEVEITLDPTNIETIAGRDVEVEITIYNHGDEQDTFDLESRGEEASWVAFEENGILIGAGGEDTVTVVISVPADADEGNAYVEIWATSRNDQSAEDDKTVKVIVEELTIGATLIRDSSGLMNIAPGTSGDFEFTILSDSNGAQLLTILTEGNAGEWATSAITEIDLEAEGATNFAVTVTVPQETPEATYRLEVILMFGDEELAKSVSNIVVQAPFKEQKEIELCLTSTNTCFISSNGMSTFDITLDMDSDSITSEQFDFTIENLGNVDMIIGFELNGPNDMTTSSMLTYTDGDGKTLWMVSIMPEDVLNIKEEYMEFGTLSILANKPEPGAYTFTLVWMEVTETGSNEMGQISVNVNIEGEATPENTTEEDDDSLLPGPSFVSIIALLGLIVYRRKK